MDSLAKSWVHITHPTVWEKSNFIPLSTPTNPFTPILNTQKPCFSRGIYTLHLGYVSYWRDGIIKNLYRLSGFLSVHGVLEVLPPAIVRWLSHCPICWQTNSSMWSPPFEESCSKRDTMGFSTSFCMFTPHYPFWCPLLRLSAAKLVCQRTSAVVTSLV